MNELMNLAVKLTICLFGWSGLLFSAPAEPEPVPVRLHVTSQETDHSSPWKRTRESARAGYGCVISPGRILTTADIVKDATMIKVEKRGEKRYYQGRVEVIDYDVDLATVSVEDESFFNDLSPVELAETVELDQPVQFLVFAEPDRIRAIPGAIVKVSVEEYYLSPDRFLTFGAAVNFEDRGGGWSEPVVAGGELVGLTMTYDGQRQYAVIIPAAIIRRFLPEIKPEGYAGFPDPGFFSVPTRDPAFRKFLQLPDNGGGIYITSVYPRSSADGVLEAGDVLLAVDGRPLDLEGYYEDTRWGRLDYRDLFTRFYSPGDRVKLELVRDGETVKLEMVLRRWLLSDYLIPPYSGREPTKYLIVGGVIIQELTRDYLREWGNQWVRRGNKKLLYHNYYNSRRIGPGRERVVLLNRVLPDEVNLGYQGLEDLVLAEVNGRPIGGIEDVAEALRFPEGEFHRFRFEEFDREIVFRAADLEEADRRIADQYEIPRLRLLE
ncbi:MAG: PDZ domain-containing protein [Candidatus Erginobacter occultus]|nr:PDZ domain-containing protein [Candidatus Erginobacter occultus]